MAVPLWRTTDAPAIIDRRSFLAGAAALGTAVVLTGPAGPAAAKPGQATAVSRRVGSLEVVALLDATGPFTLTPDRFAAFPEAEDRDWAAAERIDPGAFGGGGAWILDFRCFAVRRPDGHTLLVDTGIGPVGSPASGWAPVPGRLPDALAEAGITPANIDTVILTHLHEHHFGWSVDAQGTPTFPAATYVLQQAEVADAAGGPVDDLVLGPLRRTGQLRTVDGRVQLAATAQGDTLTVIPTPGHTVGHQSVLVEGRHDRVVVTGDVLVHAVQLADPDVGYLFEADQAVARTTRRRLLAAARAGHGHGRPAQLATSHLTRPFVPAH
jgi:glyoxylase-like metal-dependent hydrolase (beta-lactamase superfamily II)